MNCTEEGRNQPSHRHPLVLRPNRELVGPYSNGYYCDLCGSNSGMRWNCSLCNYDLCEKCVSTGQQIIPKSVTVKNNNKNYERNLTYGVEIEVFIPYCILSLSKIAKLFVREGIDCKAYSKINHDVTTHWKIVTDSSIDGGSHATTFEVVSPVFRLKDTSQLLRVLDILNRMNVQVNQSTGIHIHIGSNQNNFFDLSCIKNLMANYYVFEKVIDTLFPCHRVNNKYCQSNFDNTSYDEILQSRTREGLALLVNQPTYILRKGARKYYKINLQPLFQRTHSPTVEFRQHHGTLDAGRIIFWKQFVARFVARSKVVCSDGDTSEDHLFESILLDEVDFVQKFQYYQYC